MADITKYVNEKIIEKMRNKSSSFQTEESSCYSFNKLSLSINNAEVNDKSSSLMKACKDVKGDFHL
jgi:hypothetical protein